MSTVSNLNSLSQALATMEASDRAGLPLSAAPHCDHISELIERCHDSLIDTSSLADIEVEEYNGGSFEGPEKNLEVVFRNQAENPLGLRSLSREQLDHLCTLAKCSILSKISSNHMDAYVLSESSLFVYPNRLIMKTCGTTTLLRCLTTLLEYADGLGMELTWVGYSRKNLQNPSAQLWPHSNFGDEISYINDKLQARLRGGGHILGPVTGDHWFVYVADMFPTVSATDSPSIDEMASASSASDSDDDSISREHLGFPKLIRFPRASLDISPGPSNERTINMMMFDMAPEIAQFFYRKNCDTGKEMTFKSGIADLCPGAMIDEAAFTPCGYSMNAILHDSYYTIHVTPEPSCSYVSFETNAALRNYTSLVRNVLRVFRPKRFVLTMFGDEGALRRMSELPCDRKFFDIPSWGNYGRSSFSSTKVESDLSCFMACYSHQVGGFAPSPRESARRPRALSLC